MDAGNPMATVGMGVCNTAGPNFGPECADARFLDDHNCPKDQILSGKRVHKTEPTQHFWLSFSDRAPDKD